MMFFMLLLEVIWILAADGVSERSRARAKSKRGKSDLNPKATSQGAPQRPRPPGLFYFSCSSNPPLWVCGCSLRPLFLSLSFLLLLTLQVSKSHHPAFIGVGGGDGSARSRRDSYLPQPRTPGSSPGWREVLFYLHRDVWGWRAGQTTTVPTPPGPHGQHHWQASYPECGSHAQSPINIQTDRVTFDPELPAVQPHGYDQPGLKPLDLHNNGHTVQLSLPPSLYLEGLPRKYVAAQLHLHWGQKGSPGGSEHQINSEATAAELHIVHYDSESYHALSEAAQRPQGLAVLGILIEVGETKNPAYEHILSHLHKIRYKGQNTSVPPFDVGGLLPPLRAQFFRYNGSLTTPPCYQSVLWTVFSRRAQISLEQLEKLQETLFSSETDPSELLVQNYRAPQPLNQRPVFASFIQAESLYTTGEMLSLGVGILVGCLCLLLAVYFIARKIRKKMLGNQKSVVFTSSQATEA
ncbi:carbonic anhydrase 14 [Pteropus alecto]|uniref:carbonic anhydrase 14 n=1 Tax=Pteropus alecto TaxID=9402 RepID=UPI000D539992|nr:carbonic anhydrase 14 [Pteropus alecto]